MSRLRVRYATVFVLPPAAKGKAPVVSTSPERLVVRPGDTIEWTVVNASGVEGRVSFAWKEINPLKGGSAEALRSPRPRHRHQEGAGRRLQVQRAAGRQGAVRPRDRNHELRARRHLVI